MLHKIKVAILEEHFSLLDGDLYRLSRLPQIEVVATGTCGEAHQPMLEAHLVDYPCKIIRLPIHPTIVEQYDQSE